MTEDMLIKAAAFAFAQLARAKGKIDSLTPQLRAFIQVHSAQGIIDNGGLQYFFECNWEGNPPYSSFVDAYRTIGAKEAADALERAAGLFGFPNPHLDAARRSTRMEELWAEAYGEFAECDGVLCGNEEVWEQLGRFVAKNTDAFQLH
jgi:hypothetical protein